jgi:hypothetical protein
MQAQGPREVAQGRGGAIAPYHVALGGKTSARWLLAVVVRCLVATGVFAAVNP